MSDGRAPAGAEGVVARASPHAATIRAAESSDVEAMREIERQAGQLFGAIGMDAVAADEPFSRDELVGFIADGLAWVAEDASGQVVGYLVGRRVDGRAHLEQVSVRPSHGRRGIGRALIDRFEAWAAAHGRPALTLTTFRDVPWNGPLYERLGFRELTVDACSPELAAIRALEAAHGLDRWPRLAMIRRVRLRSGDDAAARDEDGAR